ncbi:hypothetical protein SVAN01_00808 [Stagonosporopsis vannaccii]|nr:hypothetical protein SVAN01_00808 [Stagonosporopsis vannaccii]
MAAVHTPHQHAGTTSARPAEPLLASSLIDALSLDAVFQSLSVSTVSASPCSTPQILKTGIKSLDDALGSILQPGRVVALSSETSSQRDDLAKTLLIDRLIQKPEGLAAVIDTTGNFDVVELYTQTLMRLRKENLKLEGMGDDLGGDEAKKSEDVAAKMLDRVKIMRVFDFVGVKEAVDELREGLEGRAIEEGSVENVTMPEDVVEEELERAPKKRLEVADSEDEEESLVVSDDEMLFDTKPPPADQDPSPASKQEAALPTNVHPAELKPSTSHSNSKLNLILIDNLAHVITPLLKKDTLSGTTLATTFLTTLSHLTRTHALHTLLLNPSTTPRTASPTRQPPSHNPPHQQTAPAAQQSYTLQLPPPPSIFSSNATVPALLGLLGRYADAHVLVTQMPRRKMDARVFYAEVGGRERAKRRGVEMVGVLEVVADRWGTRMGAWGVFGEKT